MADDFCWGKTYCHGGIPMLKTRIQLPAEWGGQPAEWISDLLRITEQYAEQTLLPAVCEAYAGLGSVAEKMHFEPYGYCHTWHAEPHPGSPGVLTVRIETTLSHGQEPLRRTLRTICVDGGTWRIVKMKKRRTEP